MNDSGVRFREAQPWRRSWGGPLLILSGVILVAVFVPVLFGSVSGRPPGPIRFLAVPMAILGAGLLVLAMVGELVAEVRADALYVRHFPLTRELRIEYAQIAECRARDYRPIREYGGWGVRRGLAGRGRAYNVTGSRGVQLVLHDGSRLLIGSRRADDLASAIRAAAGLA